MGKQWKQCQTLFFWAPKSLQMVTAAMKWKDAYSLEGKWPSLEIESHSVLYDSLPPHGYIVHVILQAGILKWVAFPFSRGSSQPRDQTQVSRIAGRFFTNWAIREAPQKTEARPVGKIYLFLCVCSNNHSVFLPPPPFPPFLARRGLWNALVHLLKFVVIA